MQHWPDWDIDSYINCPERRSHWHWIIGQSLLLILAIFCANFLFWQVFNYFPQTKTLDYATDIIQLGPFTQLIKNCSINWCISSFCS